MPVNQDKQQRPRREIRAVMQSDITRNTRTKVMRRRGRNTPKWKGLPKPANKSDFTPLDVVTSTIVHNQGREAGVGARARFLAKVLDNRAGVMEYLRELKTKA